MRNRFWYVAARVTLRLNTAAWYVYAFSERLRTAAHNVWLHP